MPLTAVYIREELKRRGWKAWVYYEGSSYMKIERPDGLVFHINSATPPTTSAVARMRAIDKFLTYQFLQDYQIPMPSTYLVESEEEALAAAQKIFASNKPAVVKPLDSGHGNGITVNIQSSEQIVTAYMQALNFSNRLLLQQHIDHSTDIRLLCINYTLAAALVRLPARVKGDGNHTVSELIDIENASDRRGLNYTKELNIIKKESAEKYLGKQINHVPAKEKWVEVLGTANVGTGGETIDITDELPEWLIKLAERVSRVLELPVCGVDFLVKQQPFDSATYKNLAPMLIEVNHSPALFIHETATYGKRRQTVKAYVDYLESI